MHYTPSADERDLRASLRAFLISQLPPSAYAEICDQATGFDAGVWSRLADSGWLDLHEISSMEGASAWPSAGVLMAEEFGRTLVPAPVELVAGFLLPVLHRLGSKPFGLNLDEKVFADAVPAVCVTPLLGLVYPHRAPTDLVVSVAANGAVTLSGRLSNVQFAASACSMYLPVVSGADWMLLRVTLSAPGATVAAVKTIDPGRTAATVTLDEVVVPASDVVRVDAGGDSVRDVLAGGLLSYLLFLDGKATGASEALLERTLAYVVEREQFGVPIGSFQAVKHKIAEMATAVEAARSLAAYTAWQVEQLHEDRAEAVLASRLHAAEVYRRVCEMAIQCHGGMGFTWEVGLHFWYQSAFFDAAVSDLTMVDLTHVLTSVA